MQATTLLGAVFHHERRLFRAERLTLIVALIVLAATGYAIVNGQSWVNKQQQAVRAAQTEELARVQEAKANFAAMNEGKFTPRSAFYNPANPLWVGNRHAATYAVLPPIALAATAIGQSDLNPPYVKVSADNKDTFAFNEEIENPSNLLAGNFDLAFVAVFLLPLLILALSYNVLSAEREQGTLAITLSNPVPLGALIAGKLAFRAGLVFSLAMSITVAGLIAAGAQLATLDGFVRFGWWTTLLFAYGLFWFALAIAVNALGKTSAQNALILVGLWTVLLLVLPTLISIAVNAAYPVPSRTEMVGTIRTSQTDANKEYDATDARFQQEHPEMTASPGALSGADYRSARKRVLVQQAAAERTAQVMADYDYQLASQQRVVDWLRFLSPAILMQEALNDIAGTGNRRYQHFSREVDRFYHDWQGFFLPKVLNNTPLTLADYERFPRFRYTEQSWAELNTRLLGGLLGLLIPIGLLYLFSVRRIRNYPVTG